MKLMIYKDRSLWATHPISEMSSAKVIALNIAHGDLLRINGFGIMKVVHVSPTALRTVFLEEGRQYEHGTPF